MSILKRLARRILREELDAMNTRRLREVEDERRQRKLDLGSQEERHQNETRQLQENVSRYLTESQTLRAHCKMIEMRYDEQRRFNADLLGSCKALDVASELHADRRANSQKVWLHAKIHFDRRLVQTFEKSGESPSAQALALVLARNFYHAIVALKQVLTDSYGQAFVGSAMFKAEPSTQVNESMTARQLFQQ